MNKHPRLILGVYGCTCHRVPAMACLLAAFLSSAFLSSAAARADTITLTDGRQIEGTFTRLNAMLANPGGAATATKLIVMADDGLRRTYFPTKFVGNVDPTPPSGPRMEEIDVPQSVAHGGQLIGGVGAILGITSFDKHGRRTFSMSGGSTGRIDVVQGITKITPVWCSVEGLRLNTQAYVWDMRIATSSIPRQTLSDIIAQRIDPTSADDRLRVVRLFLQQERYADAEEELNKILEEFPDRANLRDVAKELKQLGAKQILSEIETRSGGGQHQLAIQFLKSFPSEGVSGQILQQVRAKLDDYTQRQQRGQAIVNELHKLTAAIDDSALRGRIEPIVKEISDQLNFSTLDRMGTYRRFADDPNSKPEHKLSLAISGWLLGAGDASENILSSLSLVEMRDLVIDYMRADTKVKRDEILAQIKSQEAASPKLLALLLKHMAPPLEMPPEAAPGFFEMSVPSVSGEADVVYHVQLPPEYDPHATYPCVVTLHGAGTTPQHQIEWWAGAMPQVGENRLRMGQASRHGYIVIAPAWAKPHQKNFESSSREHHAVLSVLRDACRYFAIDTDRVFLSGHSMGGTAAWEIGLAHPDLWAGVIPIVATPNRMIQRYWKNAELVPLYFVVGEKDGETMQKNAPEFDRYMNRSTAFDATAVEFLGRGHEHFSDEILRIFDWMGRKRRNFFPREFQVGTQREVDSFFWWIELRSFQPPPMPMQVKSHLTANNGISIQSGGNLTVWLSPEIVDFSRPITVTLNGRPVRGSSAIQPDVGVLLEDARSRGERKHPFWARLD